MMSNLEFIADTNVLVSFSGIDRLDLLRAVCPAILIPGAVFREIVTYGSGWEEADAIQKEISKGEWLKVVDLEREGIKVSPDIHLDSGEIEVLALAMAWKKTALLDEVPARRSAEKLELRFFGTLGILKLCKDRGLIVSVKPVLDLMIEKGIRFGEPLLIKFLKESGEIV